MSDTQKLTMLSPEADAAFKELVNNYPKLLLLHRCSLLLADHENSLKVVVKYREKELRDAVAVAIGLSKPYARLVGDTASMHPKAQAAILVVMLLDHDALMLVNEE